MKIAPFTLILATLLAAVVEGYSTKSKPQLCTGEAKYAVKFFYDWTPKRFPTDFPPLDEAIFSPLTGASHNYRVSAWTVYGYATPGVEQIAESGANTILAEALGNNSLIKEVGAATGPTPYDGNHTISLTVDPKNTRISALTMIFPSPDWFTGVENKEMCNPKTGEWRAKKYGYLHPLDAGTDSESTYLSEDADTQPRENIAPILGSPFYGSPVGYYIIELVK
eukprot:Plantae.Rhodophyta-Hildenbrandia_rubra.ctg8164.p1 GENE.Plantae.Rhodophyta-Hildenbrandia_rubra.ctg8164~~Plantae.Rhodophyta-Hildenbrandia_rubra.ctg8164.p1  ORF type:complete len:223 (-),score=29.87 Plantae.Rhodophyta-Hildenbrandia_rubra.ctg8164:859-1527(-)